jgi:hypothetical protein
MYTVGNTGKTALSFSSSMTNLNISLDETAALATIPHLAGMIASSDAGELMVRRWSAAWLIYV